MAGAGVGRSPLGAETTSATRTGRSPATAAAAAGGPKKDLLVSTMNTMLAATMATLLATLTSQYAPLRVRSWEMGILVLR
jgi:hypothetical protein